MNNAESVSLLIQAVQAGNPEQVEALLKAGADANTKADENEVILVDAIHHYTNGSITDREKRGRYFKIISLLMEYGGKVDFPLQLALNTACVYEIEPLIDLFVAKGADVHSKDHNHSTAMTYAVRKGHPEAVQALFKHKAAVDSQHFFEITHLTSITTNSQRIKYLAVLSILKKQNADVDVIYAGRIFKTGCTPLICAMYNAEPLIVDWFLENAANVNKVDKNGETPLMHLAYHYVGMAQAFVYKLKDAQANMNLEDDAGRSAWYHAALQNKPELVEVLKACGAKPSVYNAVMQQVNTSSIATLPEKIRQLQNIIATNTAQRIRPKHHAVLLGEGFDNDRHQLLQKLSEMKREDAALNRGTGCMVRYRHFTESVSEAVSNCLPSRAR